MNAFSVIDSFATMNEDGTAMVSFDFAGFDKLVSELYSKRAELRKANKATVKASKEADRDAKAEVGKDYYNSLAEGSLFSYEMADGTVVQARKIATKSGSNASAACEVVSGIEVKTSAKRYPKFHQVIVPVEA